ncbi:cytochrome c family protein [Loktanella sp. SALINAS62]|uniref:c-type cytochrome n=1 Tax=Loktanella sp. SALINAS62 TaxID=2706124 RepID=UPI001B8C4DA8|nr:cytochrome c family protein [Loktanella sp. SALINAS62]MBS1303069.1 cytochrome c family protein [Loktanella sp. SALINAS62]
MFDTMTMTKALGGVCGTLLVFLLGGWAAEAIYSGGGDHGEDHAQGYVIEVPEAGDGEPAEEVVTVSFEEAFAVADASAGEGVFRNCRACHALDDGVNGVGPHLYDVVGRDVAAVGDYAYSGALVEAADVWSEEELYAFLEDPAGYAPGTKMSYSGLSDPADRADLIAYLATNPGS